MKDNQISTTAMLVSLMRALHTRLDEVKLINDPFQFATLSWQTN